MNNELVACDCSRVLHECSEKQGCRMLAQLNAHPTKTLTDEEYDNIFANGKRLGVIETEDRFRRAMALTDGEIWAIASEIEPVEIQHGVRLSNELNVLDFARAILKKASEK